MAFATNSSEPLVPSDKEAKMANEASRALSAYVSSHQEVTIELHDGGKAIQTVLPSSALRILQRILTEMGQGNAVTVMPLNAELTTQQAADFLNVSRPFLVKELEAGRIGFKKVGTHRRIKAVDLLKYKKEIDRQRRETLNELTAEAQRLGLGY